VSAHGSPGAESPRESCSPILKGDDAPTGDATTADERAVATTMTGSLRNHQHPGRRAACGLAPAKRSDFDPTRLTPQESAVAGLVATGVGNREVAAELFVSIKPFSSTSATSTPNSAFTRVQNSPRGSATGTYSTAAPLTADLLMPDGTMPAPLRWTDRGASGRSIWHLRPYAGRVGPDLVTLMPAGDGALAAH
jgi:hypothetical protein